MLASQSALLMTQPRVRSALRKAALKLTSTRRSPLLRSATRRPRPLSISLEGRQRLPLLKSRGVSSPGLWMATRLERSGPHFLPSCLRPLFTLRLSSRTSLRALLHPFWSWTSSRAWMASATLLTTLVWHLCPATSWSRSSSKLTLDAANFLVIIALDKALTSALIWMMTARSAQYLHYWLMKVVLFGIYCRASRN